MKQYLTIVLLMLIMPLYGTDGLPGMYVKGRYLYSATGDTVILRGFNAMIVYWDIHGNVNFPEIEKTGANCVRIFWSLNHPKPKPEDLDKVLGNAIAHHMIPIICLWDATGDWSKIQFCVDYWCSPEIVPILKKYERHLLLNIANEPGSEIMGDEIFRSTYQDAVQQIRNAGIHVPLIIDADRWGRNADALLNNGEYLVENDPDHNLIFSWHLWDPVNWMTGTKEEIDSIITKAANTNICFIVGEFGPCEDCTRCIHTFINWEYLIEKAHQNDIGYIPWVWKNMDDCHSIISEFPGEYGFWRNANWGVDMAVESPYSIQNTAKRPSELQTGITSHGFQPSILSAEPNPFTDAVRFHIMSKTTAQIVLEIINASGIRVKQWTYKLAVTQDCTIEWNSGDKSFPTTNGIYFYRLTIEGTGKSHIESGKLIKM